jgi:hypothetical protein
MDRIGCRIRLGQSGHAGSPPGDDSMFVVPSNPKILGLLAPLRRARTLRIGRAGDRVQSGPQSGGKHPSSVSLPWINNSVFTKLKVVYSIFSAGNSRLTASLFRNNSKSVRIGCPREVVDFTSFRRQAVLEHLVSQATAPPPVG